MDTRFYKTIKVIYYAVKIMADFIIFKLQNPTAKWFYIYKGNVESNSQYGQDAYILNHLGTARKYVEVGGNHPVRLSNSFLLEKNDWRDISIDPLNKYVDEWVKYRKNEFMNYAIGATECKKVFVEFCGDEPWYDMMSGFKEFVRDEDLITFQFKEYEVDVTTLENIICFNTFDLLLVDVEGAEMEVLQGINLNKYKPSYVMLENASVIGGSNILRQYMLSNGYRLKARIGCADDVYEIKT